MITGKEIAQLVQIACIREVCAPKPGNVSRDHDFSDTLFEDFLVSAVAASPAFENTDEMSVGEIIQQAVELTCRAVRSNTNLGIILLLAPLAKACVRAVDFNAIRPNLCAVLKSRTSWPVKKTVKRDPARLIVALIPFLSSRPRRP